MEICQKLRAIYEINGEDGWLAGANDGRDGKDSRQPDDGNGPLTKKQKKEAKKLEKAVNRPKVLTQTEIEYVGSIIHLSSCDVGGVEPRNMDEVEEVEKCKYRFGMRCKQTVLTLYTIPDVRHKANVYKTGAKHQALKGLGSIPEAKFDFAKEMEGILNGLKITDLLKRNSKNRGLKGKDVRTFEFSVAELKTLIIEDLVLVKREETETRMRRAGYLRYTNRTSFNILEDRYTNKDWRTGERIVSPLAGSPQVGSATENVSECEQKENSPPCTYKGGDYRHLIYDHRRPGSPTKVERPVLARADGSCRESQDHAAEDDIGSPRIQAPDYPPVPRKKAKKKAREARRKERRKASEEVKE